MVAGASAAFMIVAGPAVIRILYDDRYEAAGWMTRLLSIAVWFQVLEALTNNVQLVSQGNRSLALSNFARLAFVCVSLPLALSWGGAVAGVALIACADIPRYLVAAWAVRRSGLHVLRQDLHASMILATTVLAGLALDRATRDALGPLAALLGAMVAAGAWVLVRRRDLASMVADVRQRLRARPAS